MKIKTFICPVNIGEYEITDIGFQPNEIEIICVKFGGTSGLGGGIGVGFSDSENQISFNFSNFNNQNKDSGDIINGKIIQAVNQYGSVVIQANISEITKNGFKLNFNSVDPSWKIICKVR